MTQSRRPSPLQRRVLIVLAASLLKPRRADAGPERPAGAKRGSPGLRANLRASCRRLEDAGWLRTLRAPNLQLAVELTDAWPGRGTASAAGRTGPPPGRSSVRQPLYCRWSRQQVCPQTALLPLIWRCS